jgi:anaerobic selenocysteine-containing dehydrogenase
MTPTEIATGPEGGLTRRELLKGSAFLGGAALVAGSGVLAGRHARSFPDYLRPEVPYELARPENVVYTTCLQCQIRCALKAKFHDGTLVKIDGNPYAAKQVLPNVPYDTPPPVAAAIDGKVCAKGQAGVQTYADPYRLRKVLKRVGPRGSGRWRTISFEEAITEIVEGGDLFGEGHVDGFRAVWALRDAALAKQMAADVDALRAGRIDVAEFRARHAGHLDVLIDPDHPDLGPKNNGFVFLPGRINRSQVDFAKRFVTGGLGSPNVHPHTSICELSIFTATAEMTRDPQTGKGVKHLVPDYLNAEFVIFWGTGFAEANFGLTPIAELVTKNLTEGGLKVAVVDPRLSKSAAKAWRWLPVRPGGDTALALGMIRWIIDNRRYDATYLMNPNAEAARRDGETSWTDATHLVRTDTMTFLRAPDIGLGPEGFVVMTPTGPARHDSVDAGLLEVDTTVAGIPVKSVFTLLAERARERTLDEYAELSGIAAERIAEVAAELTSHGKRAAIDLYRGPAKHPGGFHAVQAINTLNVLIGNQDWKGGLSAGGGSRDDIAGIPYDLTKLHPGKMTPFGPPMSREGWRYEETTLFRRDGYPARRQWFPFPAEAAYHDIVPSAEDRYPYPVKILWLHMGTPGYSVPGFGEQLRILRDREAVPLFIATDIVIGETSMYADYIFPDLTYLERWGSPGDVPQPATRSNPVRQPAAPPVPETVSVFGAEMPISMEAVMLAIAERLGLPGFGPDGFGPGLPLRRPEDFYLKIVANLAFGTKADGSDAVPDADDEELRIFRAARRHLPASVFDEDVWRAAAGEALWRKVVYVLNRGGRFEHFSAAYDGEHMAHRFGGMWHLYLERVATQRDSVTGERFDGLPRYGPPRAADGRVVDDSRYPFTLVTYKESFATQSRTAGNYWSQVSLAPENHVLVNAADARRLALRTGDRVRLVSHSLPEGEVDLGNGRRLVTEGTVRVTEGVRPGVVAVSHHFGHWAYGASDVVVDGERIRGDARRGRGIAVNALMRLDDHLRTSALTDPIGGSVSFSDTRVDLRRV